MSVLRNATCRGCTRTPELVELCAASKLRLKAIFSPDTRPNLISRDGNDLDNRYFRLFFLLQKPL